ncbi:N-acetylmuramoyl-L-alanine amidase [Micromonospora sp. KC606]|uniref:N-acetylmuramoyl-L-alanine amidase n=1 Tax=Micromonospora sp. KC606 TaxID=2530379 RepID=UPI00104B3BB9|nr:N-acetylmuramoyl-L-alanine amidase [Micromonospora sp. KC606]TDC81913.1 N-acetylmuramoyl-L-alanine amidase [Micromonospora sp. KC606]
MRLLWLPEVLRAAGLTVHEVSGWRTRGKDTFGPVVGLTCHETRGSRTSTDAGEIRVLLNGSTSAPPPIAQLYLSRSGAWHVVASGTCYHNLVGWAGPNVGYGNDALIGVEAQHAAGEPWTDTQYRSYVRGVAAITRRAGFSVSRVAGHFEHQPGAKTDPGFDMAKFRRDIAAVLAGKDDDMSEKTQTQINELHAIVTAWRSGMPKTPDGRGVEPVGWRIRDEQWQAKVVALLTMLSGQIGGLDTAQVLARIEELAAAESARDAELIDLVRRGQSGELAAEQVVDELAKRLAA